MEVGSPLPPGAQALLEMQPGEPALDHPAMLTESGTVRDSAAGNPRGDPADTQQVPVIVVVVATVGEQFSGFAPGAAAEPADRHSQSRGPTLVET